MIEAGRTPEPSTATRSHSAPARAGLLGLTVTLIVGCAQQSVVRAAPPPFPPPRASVAARDGAPLAPLAEPASTEDSDSLAEPLSGQVDFRVEQAGPELPWRFEITNGRTVPVRVVADRRLLWFEVMAPSAKKPKKCRLPEELLPQEGARVPQVKLEPGDSFHAHFDPRFYCFAADGQQWLVPGAVVRPRFGWPELPATTTWKAGKRVETPVEQQAPFVVEAVAHDADQNDAPGEHHDRAPNRDDNGYRAEGTTPIKTLEGPAFALRSEYADWSRSRLSDTEARSDLTLTIARGSDAHSEFDATVEVALANRSQLSKRVFFRRELVAFEVAGPGESTSCAAGPDERVPDASAFERFRPGHRLSFTIRLAELCPRGTFSKPGLYLVYARFDSDQSGAQQGLDAFTGTLVSSSPALVRIRTGEAPFIRRHTGAGVPPQSVAAPQPGLAPQAPNPVPAAPVPLPQPPPHQVPPVPPAPVPGGEG